MAAERLDGILREDVRWKIGMGAVNVSAIKGIYAKTENGRKLRFSEATNLIDKLSRDAGVLEKIDSDYMAWLRIQLTEKGGGLALPFSLEQKGEPRK